MSRNRTNAGWVGIGMAALILLATAAPARAAVVRQPYLQLTTPTSVTVVWRTDTTSDSRVRYGTVQGSLTSTVTVATSVTNHVVTITGLTAATKYYYDAGSSTAVQAGGTAEHYFVTAPTPGSSPSFRAWIVGDSGTGGSDQIAVRNAMLAYTGAARPDMMLHVGDIAYTSGSETEFTDFHFTMYQDIARHTVQWPTLGNHEGASTTSGQPGASTGPYYDAYVLPTSAEAGGAASGTEAYYSFNYGNTHFISLNSYQVSRSASGPMATWLQSDLSATNAQWIVAFWHHPPYSHGTHNSDTETELREMRSNILPILEAGGVDLVLCGHSHNYERSYLIDGTYSTPTPDFATLEATGHILDDGNGKPTGDGPYQKGAGNTSHGGAVYVVAGHGGAATGGTLDHPVMYFSETLHGSCILDVSGSSLTLTNVRASGVVSDTFQIMKGPQSPKVTSTNPPKSAVLTALSSVQVTFSTGVTGVDAGDLSVNGSAATSVTGPSGGSVYTFSGFAAPANGHVGVVLVAGGIADAVNPGLQFTGNVWSYTIDTTPPRVATEIPARGKDVGVLPSITVNFTKAVTGVIAGDLRVNGQAATAFSGVAGSAGPYTFTGYPAPGTGLVTVTMLAGAIQDEQAQPFAGDSWNYVLRPHLVINEYLTSNNSSEQDEFGEFDDYIEIYNPSNVAVDMSGMHLTDTLDFPAQYEIPDGVTIPAHGHLVFWCDGQTSQGPMHTNFNLARAGEAAGLFDTAGNGFAPIDSTSWVNATTDVPVGRFPDGAPGFVNVLPTAGATNSISCTTAAQCSALADACNVGACVGNQCVAQPANEGQACDDGIACRGPDTCTAGVCDGGPSLCTGGQSCNLVTGLCETPLADPLPVNVGASFKYFKGATAPPATWSETSFDDSTWLSGATGFGYGTDCAAQHGTVLSDMLSTYASVYVRHRFRVDNPSAVASMLLTMDYDDGFVAYINGHEVARSNVVGTPPSNTQLATADHECSTCGATCNPAEAFTINLVTAQLVAGNNVLAIQGHNLTTGSTDFTLIPTLSATEGQGCAVNPECDDNNPCTDDSCVAGACQHSADDTNACSDGIACTNDTCSSGACVTTSACPVGRTCNLGNGLCESTPVTVSFQQGTGGYTGAVDTYTNAADLTSHASSASLTVDVSPGPQQALLKFGALFASEGGPIPNGATIASATLALNITNLTDSTIGFHPMLQAWADTALYTTFGSTPWNSTAGIQVDNIEAATTPDASRTFPATGTNQTVDVTARLQAWAVSPASNFGWVVNETVDNSVVFDSAEGTTPANRPTLSVTYTFSPPCSVDADCTDNNVCNGIETCVATVCQAGTSLVCNDGNGCTTDSCNPATGCTATNNTNPCSDGDACTANDTCAGGVCVSGAATNCNDANACTDDSCSSLTGCVHTNNTGSCTDANLCTTGDVCSGGTCTGTAVSCGVGQTCNPGTGLCQSGPTTVTFQNGATGYGGSVDTYIDTALGSQAGVSPIVVDGSPVEQALLRFDGIFGSGPNQIPAGSTISSATLTLWVGSNTSDESSDTVSFHRLLHAWSDTAVWAAYGVSPWNAQAGIQNDDVDAVTATTATATMSALSTSYPVDVTTSLQAWAASPSSNFGWVILPPAAGTNGLRLESNESTTASNTRRPLLSVTYNAPAASCTTNADCSDNNVCNGIETCVATVCQPGTALNCDDTNVCTTDSCNALSGCQHVNNTSSCSDGNACTANDTCAGGLCVAGPAANCNDGVACTADSCNTGTGCLHASTCGAGLTCNLTSGLCESAPTSTSFQDGVSGYTGTQDTYLAQSAPTSVEGALDNWRWDLENPSPNAEFGLILFDNIVGSGPGQIPAGATITSASLTLEVSNNSVAPEGSINESAVDWSEATATWNNFGGDAGVQPDEYLATPQYLAPLPTGSAAISVTASVQAWVDGTRSNFGWVFRPNSTDGAQVDSAEFATVSLRPKLTVQYQTASGPSGQLRCELSSATVAPGGSVRADVFLDNLAGLAGIRGYQTKIAVARTSGTGTASVACPSGVRVNELRAEYLFAGQSPTFPASNCGQLLATSSILSGSVIAGPAPNYLSDATIDISADAALGSTFTVTVLPSPGSDLANATGDPVGFTTSSACTITVAGCGTAADCDDGNVCTTDSCNAGSCANVPNSIACSDGDACTAGDVCSAGACAGTPLNCSDGDACTTDVCTAGVCTHPVNGACGVTGNVVYYRNSAASSEPSTKPVPNVSIDGTQDLVADDVTDATGGYGFANLFGNVTIATLPKFGSPRISDDNGAVTSFDASVIGQAAVNDITLSANQAVAGDVTGNGQVTSFDAAKVAQYAVALIDHFDVAVSTGSDWRLFRCDTYTSASNQNCGSPQYVFAPLGGAQTANFYAVLYGDVTGNWSPAALLASRATVSPDKGEAAIARSDADRASMLRASGAVRPAPRTAGDGAVLSLSGWDGPLAAGERRTVVLQARSADGIEAIDLALRFDPRIATVVEVKPLELAGGWSVAHHEGEGGAKVAMYGVTPLHGSGALLSITIEAKAQITVAPISVEASANEGAIPLRIHGGRKLDD
jgi:hypothetical protein